MHALVSSIAWLEREYHVSLTDQWWMLYGKLAAVGDGTATEAGVALHAPTSSIAHEWHALLYSALRS